MKVNARTTRTDRDGRLDHAPERLLHLVQVDPVAERDDGQVGARRRRAARC